MFIRRHEYRPEVEHDLNEKVTSLLKKDNKLWIGREDGFLECHNENIKFSTKLFESEYDYLESEEIKPKVIAIEHMNDGSVNDIIFCGNEKTIKMFKIRNDAPTIDICNDLLSPGYRISEIKKCSNIHTYVLNSISLNRSKEYLVSTDYLEVNLWKPSRMDNFYNIINLKPELTSGTVFVINSCKFNPFTDNLLVYSTTNGEISLNDISIAPKAQKVGSMKNNSTFSIKSISDFSFIDSNLLISRSLNNICLFDLRNTKTPIFNKELICDFEEQNKLNFSDAIYEKFKIVADNMFAYTGSYFNTVYSINVLTGTFDEIIIGSERAFGIDNKIRLIETENDGFSCILNGVLIKYAREI